jgi:hypothetical protein
MNRAELLVAEGRLREAIEVLTDANRAHRDHATEARLVELRRDASMDPPPAARRGMWARIRQRLRRDHFRGTDGVPEVEARDLSVAVLRSGIQHHGCLLVRGLLDDTDATRLVQDIDRAFDAYDARLADPTSPPSPWLVPFTHPAREIDRSWVRAGGGVLTVDSPPALFDVIDAFERAGVRDLVSGYFSEPGLILAAKWVLRRMRPREHRLEDWDDMDFHQDGSFMGAGIRSLNLWVSLSHCGETAPGLEVVPRRLDGIVQTGGAGAVLDWTVSSATAQGVGDGVVCAPRFEPGDALFFDHLLLHRTGLKLGMTDDRYAIEAWFGAPSPYTQDQAPIVF